MTHRHTVDSITSDALDALYEQLEAAEDSETQRQLATAREAFASATSRAASAEAELAALRQKSDAWASEANDTIQEQRQRAETAEARLAHLQQTSKAAGILLTRTTDERDQLRARVDALADRLDRFAQTTIRVADGPLYASLANDLRRTLQPGPAATLCPHGCDTTHCPCLACEDDQPGPAATEATERPTLRARSRARWNALTPEQQAARMAELDAIDNPDVITDRATIRNTLADEPGCTCTYGNRCPNCRD